MQPAWQWRPASSTCCLGHRTRCYIDGRSQSDIRQGVTLEVFGEGESLGPLTDEVREADLAGTGRSEASNRLDDSRRRPRRAGEEGHIAEHRIVRRRGDGDS